MDWQHDVCTLIAITKVTGSSLRHMKNLVYSVNEDRCEVCQVC